MTEAFSKRSKQKGSLLMTELTLTTIFEEAEEGGYVGYVAELPGVNTQGESLEEVRESLGEAVELILSSNRERSEKSFSKSGKVTRERIVFRVV
ncbi:MAG TPA: type II toxin-antitoxin system HicB family antitoxin [Pyrinomonadaceae bacterium]